MVGRQRVGGVLDHRQAVGCRDREHRVHVDRMPGEMHGDDRPRRQLAGGLDGHDGPLESRRIDVERLRVDVDELGYGVEVLDDVGGRAERHRRREHRITGTDPERGESHVESIGAGVHGQGPVSTHPLGEGLLEPPDLGTGGDPVGLEGRHHLRDLGVADPGRRERQELATHRWAGPSGPASRVAGRSRRRPRTPTGRSRCGRQPRLGPRERRSDRAFGTRRGRPAR